ncbi:MAG: DNA polymerase IV [Clostridiales bacterium]|nr:DNA polymerase IV [Clostridiales bacterium]MDU1041855.1 DNA polymerase IV [Clostridiales bacterium]MDU3489479.1 DNA polymerase IV [Clostridiales bacterium]
MRTIIHVDMDAFYAAVEIRDDPSLQGIPLIIGSLPDERGVVSTCSYEARLFGIKSGMSIKEAYRRCPKGHYMHPNFKKYTAASSAIHKIWSKYTDTIEYVALDEAYLDVTESIANFGGPAEIAGRIKRETYDLQRLSCSVGVGYSMQSAKLASEEKKPNGLFLIPNSEFLIELIKDRPVSVIHGIGKKTAKSLNDSGIYKVSDIWEKEEWIERSMGKHGRQIVEFSHGIDHRRVVDSSESERKSIGKEMTFQTDISDFQYLRDVLVLIAKDLSLSLKMKKLYAETITLKMTYADMTSITRSVTVEATDDMNYIYKKAEELLSRTAVRSVRLIGIRLNNFTDKKFEQLTFNSWVNEGTNQHKKDLEEAILNLQMKFGPGIIKRGNELQAQKHLESVPKITGRKKDKKNE